MGIPAKPKPTAEGAESTTPEMARSDGVTSVAPPVAVETNVKFENRRLSIVHPPAVLRPMSVAYVPELGQVAGAAFAKGIAHAEMNKNVSKTRTRTICGSRFWVLLKVHRPL